MKYKIIILGAGLQGSCIALELAKRGYRVQLLDQDSVPVNRASIRNEGKVHLGLVYMNDSSFLTPEMMLKTAVNFSKYLFRWIGPVSSRLNVSTPFYYLVSKHSFLTLDQLEERYGQLQEIYDRQISDLPDTDYLGIQPAKLAERCPDQELSSYFNMNELQGGFKTPELSVDTEMLADCVRNAIRQHPNIEFFSGHKICELSRSANGFKVEGINKDGTWSMAADQVVNATWEGKYIFDRMLDVPVPTGILHRLKYRVIADIPPDMVHFPSVTMVIGRFGDVVIRPDATAYLSWYPEACRGWSTDIHPPESWADACRGTVSKEDFEMISEKIISNIRQWYPAIKHCKPKIVDAGAIVAYGNTDVDDKNSRLHHRAVFGASSYDGYHTVYTGKLTSAPQNAMQTADCVEKFADVIT